MAVGPLAHVAPWQNEQEEENRHRYFGEYLGFVRDNKDPEKRGRVRIHVPALLGAENVPDHWLDWALPKSVGLNVPDVGATVNVTFEQGYVQHAIYTHGWISGEDAASSAAHKAGKGELDSTWLDEYVASAIGGGPALAIKMPKDSARDNLPVYPFNRVWASQAGHVIELDDSPGFPRARYVHPSGSQILIDADGSFHFVSKGAMHFRSKGDMNFVMGDGGTGGTMRALYPGGSGFSLGPSGFHVTGSMASILGRTITRRETAIN